MAITPNNAFVAGQVLTAQEQNNFPRGVVALTSNTTTTITSNILVGLNTTYTFEAGRTYKISTAGQWTIVTSGSIILEILVDGTVVQRYFDSRFAAFGANFLNANGFWVGSVAAGSKQVQVKITVVSGTAGNSATATSPNQLVIEDIGTA